MSMIEWSTRAAGFGARLGDGLACPLLTAFIAAFLGAGFLAAIFFFGAGFFAAGLGIGIGIVMPAWPACCAVAGVAASSARPLVAHSRSFVTLFSYAATKTRHTSRHETARLSPRRHL
jgi:hypothetical protein